MLGIALGLASTLLIAAAAAVLLAAGRRQHRESALFLGLAGFVSAITWLFVLLAAGAETPSPNVVLAQGVLRCMAGVLFLIGASLVYVRK